MKKVITKKVLTFSVTLCYDEENDKYYQFRNRNTGFLYDELIGHRYSEQRYEITDLEAHPQFTNKINKQTDK